MAAPIRKPCPKCGADMVERRNKENGSTFLGCTAWPPREDEATGEMVGCSHTEPIPMYYRLLRAGAETLPGFDV